MSSPVGSASEVPNTTTSSLTFSRFSTREVRASTVDFVAITFVSIERGVPLAVVAEPITIPEPAVVVTLLELTVSVNVATLPATVSTLPFVAITEVSIEIGVPFSVGVPRVTPELPVVVILLVLTVVVKASTEDLVATTVVSAETVVPFSPSETEIPLPARTLFLPTVVVRAARSLATPSTLDLVARTEVSTPIVVPEPSTALSIVKPEPSATLISLALIAFSTLERSTPIVMSVLAPFVLCEIVISSDFLNSML